MSGEIVERHYAEWIAAHAAVPGTKMHADDDVVWMLQSGAVWRNAGARVRLTPRSADRRLDTITARFRAHGRGGGFWVGPDATPSNLEERLRARGYRCRKRFPAMLWQATSATKPTPAPRGLRVEVVEDHAMFTRAPGGHPYFGPISTDLRRCELSRVTILNQQRPRSTFDLVAILDREPVGACTVHLSPSAAGLHDVGVLESHRNRGIGAALVRAACGLASERGQPNVVLISSGMGESVYRQVGFREVCKIAFFYQAFAI